MGRIENKRIGQSTIEFTFSMVVIAFLAIGLIAVFRWVGLDLAERRVAHDQSFNNPNLSIEQQLNPDFYKPRHLDAMYHGNIVK